MPYESTVSYWTVCWKWGFIPYPCKKTAKRWCYDFSSLKETGYGFICRLEGCEHGILYKWWAFCFNIFGSTTYPNVTKCFKTKRSEAGTCR